MERDVFISYASGDRETADTICEVLEDGGLTCWMAPRDVVGNYGAAIIRGIESSRMMVLVFSSKANVSRFVHREVERAAAKNLTIYVVRIEDVPAVDELELFISADQWFDAASSPVTGRREELVQKVKQRLGGSNGPTRKDQRGPSWQRPLRNAIKPIWGVLVGMGIILSLAVWKWGMPLIRGTGGADNKNVAASTPSTQPTMPANTRTTAPTPTQNTQPANPAATLVAVLPSPSTPPTPGPTPAVVESLEDTQWEYKQVGQNVEYVWEFHPGKRFRTRRFSQGTYLPDGKWEQVDNAVTIRIGDAKNPETYRGKIRGNIMEGTFVGLNPARWTATKIEP